MPTLVRCLPATVAFAALLAAASGDARALELRQVQVQGLEDEEMRDNVDDALSLQRLNPNRRKALTESRLSYLLRQVPREVRGALEPFGYYDPTVDARVQRDGDAISVVVSVVPGEPVRVRGRDLSLTGAASTDNTGTAPPATHKTQPAITAAASLLKCRVPWLSRAKARKLPRSSSGTVLSLIEKSRTCSS